MLPQTVTDNRSRIDAQIALMDGALGSSDIRLQSVFAAHLVTLSSGHVEFGLREILRQYAMTRSNGPISTFIGKSVDRENSVNCEKIKKVLDRFDSSWHGSLITTVSEEEKEAVDSLKTLRDQIAHGRPNGTGYITVRGYCGHAFRYVEKLASAIL